VQQQVTSFCPPRKYQLVAALVRSIDIRVRGSGGLLQKHRYLHISKPRYFAKSSNAGTTVGQGGIKELGTMETYEKTNKSLPIMLVSVQQQF